MRVKIVPDMTYNVFGGTLNPTLLLHESIRVSITCPRRCIGFSISASIDLSERNANPNHDPNPNSSQIHKIF